MWYFRLKVESNHNLVSYVVTLTYNDLDLPPLIRDPDSGLEYHPIRYSDIQLFNKRLRKVLGSFRFFACCEYGPEHLRPHYHIVYWFKSAINRFDFDDAVFRSWFPQSRITIDQTNDKAAEYVLSYCLSSHGDIPKCVWPKIKCSTKPFIGHGLLENDEFLRYCHLTKKDLTHYAGYNQRLPRILRDAIFSDEEKKFIKNELGSLISSRSEKKFLEVLKLEQKYGLEKAMQYPQMDRNSFNRKVQRTSKIKSIK